jgi:hypothetical protein
MFIRRGVYKLRFEVESEEQLAEVNMVDANEGFDGDSEDKQGEGNKGNNHDIDMDNKNNELEEGDKNDDNHSSSKHNGVDGMQEQGVSLEAIQFGSLDVKHVSPGNIDAAKKSDQIGLIFQPISHVIIPVLDDKINTDSDADLVVRGASSGSVPVGGPSPGRNAVIGLQKPGAVLVQPAANQLTPRAVPTASARNAAVGQQQVGDGEVGARSSAQRPRELSAVTKLHTAQKILHTPAGLSFPCAPGDEDSGAGVDLCPNVQVGSSVKGFVETQGVFSFGFDANNEHVGNIGHFQHDDVVSLSQTL